MIGLGTARAALGQAGNMGMAGFGAAAKLAGGIGKKGGDDAMKLAGARFHGNMGDIATHSANLHRRGKRRLIAGGGVEALRQVTGFGPLTLGGSSGAQGRPPPKASGSIGVPPPHSSGGSTGGMY